MIPVLALALVSETALPPTPPCYFMAVAANEGEVVDPSKTTIGACSQSDLPAKLSYDRRAAVARAAVDLRPGDELGAVYLPPAPQVLPGDRLALTRRLGRVAISREVTALQRGGSGQWLFVRDDAGKVFKARLPADGIPKGTGS